MIPPRIAREFIQVFMGKNNETTGPKTKNAQLGKNDKTEMTGNTLRNFLDPVFGRFGLTKLQKLGHL